MTQDDTDTDRRRRRSRIKGAAAGAAVAVSLFVVGLAIDEQQPPTEIAAVAPSPTNAPRATATAVPPVPTPTTTPTAEPLISLDDLDYTDPGVIMLWQVVLASHGFDLNPDGVFGPATEAATAAIQERLGLPTTGLVDAKTFSAAQALLPSPTPAPTPTQPPTPSPQPTPTPRPTAVPAAVSINCPPDDSGNWDWYDAVFGISASPQSVPLETMTITYGDGTSSTARTWNEAERNLASHRYWSTGTFTVEVQLSFTNTPTVRATCSWSWTLAQPDASCSPHYDPCVPIASDVDCGGGSGNGPAYVWYAVRVIGADIYGLDRDDDGWGCDNL